MSVNASHLQRLLLQHAGHVHRKPGSPALRPSFVGGGLVDMVKAGVRAIGNGAAALYNTARDYATRPTMQNASRDALFAGAKAVYSSAKAGNWSGMGSAVYDAVKDVVQPVMQRRTPFFLGTNPLPPLPPRRSLPYMWGGGLLNGARLA